MKRIKINKLRDKYIELYSVRLKQAGIPERTIAQIEVQSGYINIYELEKDAIKLFKMLENVI